MAGGDSFYSNVALLLHCDGTNGATTVPDTGPSPKTLTLNGNAQLSTAQKKYGSASLAFDGAGDYASTPAHADFNFGTGDFTVETWARFNAVGQCTLISNYQGVSNGWTLAMTAANKLFFNCSGDGIDVLGTTVLTTGRWYHIAVARAGTSLTLFLDGAVETTITDSQNITSTLSLVLGRDGIAFNSGYFNGYLDEVRITKGVARYTAAFTVPSQAHPNA